MTVRELIEALEWLPKDANVQFRDMEYGDLLDVNSVHAGPGKDGNGITIPEDVVLIDHAF